MVWEVKGGTRGGPVGLGAWGAAPAAAAVKRQREKKGEKNGG